MEEQNTEKKDGRGGARPGAGRKKKIGVVQTICLRIPEDVAAILETQPNKSKYIVEAIRAYAREQG